MNIYIYVNPTDNKATSMTAEYDPTFPEVPITDRYSASFLAHCVVRTSEQIQSQQIELGMVYDADTDTFAEPVLPEPEPSPASTGFSVSSDEVNDAYRTGVNSID